MQEQEENKDRSTERILVVTPHAYVTDRLVGTLASNGYEASGLMDDEHLLRALSELDVDLLLIGGGVEPARRQAIREVLNSRNQPVPIVEHYGGPATLLQELKEAFQR